MRITQITIRERESWEQCPEPFRGFVTVVSELGEFHVALTMPVMAGLMAAVAVEVEYSVREASRGLDNSIRSTAAMLSTWKEGNTPPKPTGCTGVIPLVQGSAGGQGATNGQHE